MFTPPTVCVGSYVIYRIEDLTKFRWLALNQFPFDASGGNPKPFTWVSMATDFPLTFNTAREALKFLDKNIDVIDNGTMSADPEPDSLIGPGVGRLSDDDRRHLVAKTQQLLTCAMVVSHGMKPEQLNFEGYLNEQQ